MQITVYPLPDSGAVVDFAHDLSGLADEHTFVAVQTNVDLDMGPLQNSAQALGVRLFGTTSCLGAMSSEGACDGAVACVLRDPDGDFGVGLAALGDHPKDAARRAVTAALAQADRPGEIPDLVWVSATPGQEEAVLDGITAVVGADVPIVGGSAADNTVSGDWFVFDRDAVEAAGVVVGVLFPSAPLSVAYQSGYTPTTQHGTVTRAEGRRIAEINSRPAAEVYAEWTNGAVPTTAPTSETAMILADSTPWPLGRQTHSVGGVPFHLLAHPAAVDSAGGLHLFADVSEGEELVQMQGSVASLTERAGRVASQARSAGAFANDQIAGALVVYCGGCMLYVRDQLDDVVQGLRSALPDVPFAGLFTFGEQGPTVGGGNRHGNLMISCVVFGK